MAEKFGGKRDGNHHQNQTPKNSWLVAITNSITTEPIFNTENASWQYN